VENLNFDLYFEHTNSQYYDAKYVITILENILGNKFEVIKSKINDTQITVTKEQITDFLEKKFEEEDPELKRRIENPKHKRTNNLIKLTDKNIEDSVQAFIDEISVSRYYFEPYTLQYFNKYTSIVRDKILLLLNIIEQIGNRNSMPIKDLIAELDIRLDENGNISKEDIIRLITPVVYNIEILEEKVSEANDLSTYLNFKMSKDSLYKDGLSEGEIYPSTSLQIKSSFYGHVKGNVPLSSTQRDELKQERGKSMKKILEMLRNF